MGTFAAIADYGQGGYKVLVVSSILIVMQILMVGGRLLSRNMQKAGLAADDYFLFLATAIGFSLCAVAIAFPRVAAFGPHIEMIEQVNESEGRLAGQMFVVWMVLYGFAIATAKCAILLLYMRVFTSRMRAFTVMSYIVGFVVVATCIANTLVAVFGCTPIHYAWDKSVKGGTCIDELAFARFMSIPNIVTGAVMLIMPLPLVWRLNVAIAAKVALTATFLHGIIGFVASCARLSILFKPDSTSGMDTTAIAWTIWTLNEPANYVIAACLPTLRPVFIRILPPSFFLLSKQSSNKKSYTSNIKVSWPKGSMKPSFRLETNTRVAMTDSRITGPWDATRTDTVDMEKDVGLVEKGGMRFQEHATDSGTTLDMADKERQVLENVVEVNTRDSL